MADIIVVDDEKVIRILLREILQAQGHQVRMTDNGAAALELFEEKVPDLLITDIFMPEKTGLEAIKEVRQNYQDVKIIAISGDSVSREGSHMDSLEMAMNLGCSRVIEKPFTKKEVLDAVDATLK